MEIKDAQYNKNDNGDNVSINCTIGEVEWSIPLDPSNAHYAEILKRVKEGTLTIKDAD